MLLRHSDFKGLIVARARHLSRDGGVFSVAAEITNQCNLSCGFCPNPTISPNFRYFHNIDTYVQILQKIRHFFIASRKRRLVLSPCGLGELFILPNAVEYLEAARRILPEALIDVSSNFTCMDRDTARAVVEEKLIHTLTCSMNYSNREKYKEICGRDSLPDVFSGLDTVVDFIKKHHSGMKLYIAMKNDSSVGAEERRDFERIAAARWGGAAHICWADVGNWGGGLDLSSFSVAPGARLKFPCYSLFQMKLFVNGVGDIFPCCCCAGAPEATGLAALRLGNVFSSDWNSIERQFVQIRNTHLRGEWNTLSLCAECNVYTDPKFNLFFRFGDRFF